MSLKIKIAARLKAKAAGVNLSQKRIELIVARAEKGGLTDESDDTAIDAQLDIINEITPFTELASLDDHQRAKDKKLADDKEAKRLADIEAGKTPEVDLPTDAPEWMKIFMEAQAAQTKALTDQIAAISGEKVTNTRSQTAAEKLKDAPEWFRNDVLEDLKDRQFADEDQYNSFLDRKVKGLENIPKSEEPENGIGSAFRPIGSVSTAKAGEKEVSPAMKELIAERTAKAEAKTAQNP